MLSIFVHYRVARTNLLNMYKIHGIFHVTLSHPTILRGPSLQPPPGTLHEAIFDPVALSGGGVGATGSSGVIDPDEFTVSSDDYEIDALSGAAPWHAG